MFDLFEIGDLVNALRMETNQRTKKKIIDTWIYIWLQGLIR